MSDILVFTFEASKMISLNALVKIKDFYREVDLVASSSKLHGCIGSLTSTKSIFTIPLLLLVLNSISTRNEQIFDKRNCIDMCFHYFHIL